jgi:hypothetical protein
MVTARAADDEQKAPPEEIPNFNQLDEYIYVPKSTLSLGARLFLKGPKATYAGQGSIPSPVDPGGLNTVGVPNISRTYIDGTVSPDARSFPVNNGVGETSQTNIPQDGRTNTWSYDNQSQLLANGDMTFHTYSGQVTDTDSHPAEGVSTAGVELILDHDMGKLGKHITWSLTAGFSIADIHSSAYASVPTELTTVTDTYDLFGQVPPPAPFSSPNTVTQTVLNSTGQAVSGSGTTTQTQQADQTILLGNQPLNRTYTNTLTDSENRYFIEGAYYTLRFGPTVIIPVGQRFKLAVSVGPALIYAGSEFNVLEDLTAATGEAFTDLYQKENTKIMPGYYVDVNLRYDLTDTAGFYVGGLYEGAGGFNQSVASGAGSSYTTHIDFGNQEGVKGGLTLRF